MFPDNRLYSAHELISTVIVNMMLLLTDGHLSSYTMGTSIETIELEFELDIKVLLEVIIKSFHIKHYTSN